MKKLPLVVLIAGYFFSTQSAFANRFTVVLTKPNGSQIVLGTRAPKLNGTLREAGYRVALEFSEHAGPGKNLFVLGPHGERLVTIANGVDVTSP